MFVQKLAIVWCIKNDIDTGEWAHDDEQLMEQLEREFTETAFIDSWDEEACLRLLGKLTRSEEHGKLWDALDKVTDLPELMEKLAVSTEELEAADEQLEQSRQQRDLQKKTVSVCGADFINTGDNLNYLWDHVIQAIKDDDVAIVDLGDLEELNEQNLLKTKPRKRRKPNEGKKPKVRMSQAVKDLLGLTGEIHAYRALQKVYGSIIVGPSCWISENSLQRFPKKFNR